MCPGNRGDDAAVDDGSNQPDRSEPRTTGRRSVLKGLFGVGGSAGLAGCFGDGDGASPTATDTTTTDEMSPTTRSESPTASATETQTQPSDGVPVVPPGGDIQGAIDDVAGGTGRGNQPWGKVRLKTAETYRIDEPILMREGSILECNGSKLVPTDDVTLIDASASSYVIRPFIDARGVDVHDSPLIKVSTREGPTTANNPAIVERMYLYAHREHGTGVQVIDDKERGQGYAQLSGIIHHPRVGLHFRAEGDGSFVNSNQFTGYLRNNETNILMDSKEKRNAVNSNIINVGVQPNEKQATWFWDLQTGGRNVVNATVWDVQYFNNQKIWRIGETAGQRNKFVDQPGSYTWDDNVVENLIGDGPNGTFGNVLFDYTKAHTQLDLKRDVDDLRSRIEDLEAA